MSPEQELKISKKSADSVAIALRSAINPGSSFTLCEDLPGVLVQIENMIGILLRERIRRDERPFIQRLLLG